MKKIYNKIFSLMCLSIILISNIIANVSFALGSGSFKINNISTHIKTTKHNESWGIAAKQIYDSTTSKWKTAFCIEMGAELSSGTKTGNYTQEYTKKDLTKAYKVAYIGWYLKHGNAVVSNNNIEQYKTDYAFTQQLIWQVLGYSAGNFIDSSVESKYQDFKKDVLNEIAQMDLDPSFNGKNLEIDLGDSYTLTDSNSVLESYPTFDVTDSGIRFQHTNGSNNLKITVTSKCTIDTYALTASKAKKLGISLKYGGTDFGAFIFDDGNQSVLVTNGYGDDPVLYLNLKINLLGKLELTKLDTEKNVINGSKIRVIGNDYNELVTVKDGKITIEKLKIGTYTVKEEYAPEGYVLNTETYKVEIKTNKTTTQTIVNSEPTGTITIIKKDSETGSVTQGDAIFTGAVYKVYAKEDIYNKAKTKKFYSAGDLVATRTMDEKGTTEDVTNLPLGKYIVKEEIASLGYMLDTKEYEVNLVYKDQYTKVISNTTTSLENVKKMGVHIFKSGIKENSGETPGLEGAEFTIKLNSAVERAYAQGYTYAEVWNGIDENGNQVKVDSKRVAEAQVIAPSYETIKTDKDGNAYTQKNLPYGKYIVKETKTPIDYETAVDFTFSITDDESEVKEIAKKTKHLVVNNEQLETYIKLIKKDLKTGKLVTLNSTTFEIKATKDIYDRATKKILFKKGESISQKIGNTTYTSFTTNADNIVVPDSSFNSKNDDKATITTPLKLPVGSYEITEIKVPTGFLQLDKSVTFEIKNVKDYDTDKDGDFIKEVVVKNEQPTGTIKLDKTIALREDADTSLIDTSDLSGIEFKLSAKENIIDMADGSVIYKKGQEIKKYNLTKDGKLSITNLPMGTYEIVETKTLDGLVLNTTKYEVKFEQKDLTTKIYETKLDISNDTTLVKFSKTDITGDKELIGAKLTVLDNENNIIDTWTSTEKTHKIEGLTIGKEYTLKEEIAPEGYVVATSIKFTIKDTNEIQKVNMIDKIVEISKVDIAGDEIEGATIQVLDKDNKVVDEWVSGKEPHKIKNLVEGETYTLHEEIVADSYVKATDVEFKVTTDKETQKVVMIDKIVEMSKVDIAGEKIAGATIQVLDKDNKVVDEWVSGKEPHKIKNLVEGETYTLHEEIVADSYVKATDVEFIVTTDKETQKVVMIDKLVEITKTDIINGNELEGAELEVTNEDGNTIDKWTSTKEPHKVKGLEEGKTYILKETTAPYGYEITEEIKFTVTTDKETQKIEMKDMPILKNVKVIKIDTETKEVIKDKFIFAIYEDPECTKLIKEVKSNSEDGTALFEELRYGTYYIKEIKAPKDYELSNKIVKVEINDKGIFVDDTQVEENENTIEFTFENKKIEVPKTGVESKIKLFASAIILSLLGIAYIIKRKQNKDK